MTPPKYLINCPTMVHNQNGNSQMTDKEYKTQIARKFSKIQVMVANQHKETSKAVWKMKGEINILKRNQSELLELKKSPKKFQNTIENYISSFTKKKEDFQRLKTGFLN